MITKHAFLNNPVVSALLLDRDFNIVFSNPHSRDSLGYTEEEMVGRPLSELVWDESAEGKLKQSFHEFNEHQNSVANGLDLRTKGGWKLASHLALEWTEEDQEGERWVAATIVVGNYEVHAVEAALHSSRLATLGEMATGVAHELNQPLNVIRMASSNVLRRLEKGVVEPGYLRDKLERILDQADRAAQITSQMRDYGRKKDNTKEVFSVSEALLASCSMFAEEFRLSGIQLKVADLGMEPDKVFGNRMSLEQPIINLLTNARDSVLVQEEGDKFVSVETFLDGLEIQISVSDSGGGPSKETRDRVFEPFFTTKGPSKGTGLGLYISHSLIKSLGGRLEFVEHAKKWAFKISLPLCCTPASQC